MWFTLDLDGITLHLRIQNYKKSSNSISWDENWTCVDLTLQAKEWLNYQIKNDEIMLACEVEELRDKLGLLLVDGLTEPYSLELIEPDLTFELNPKKDIRNDPRILYVRPGFEIVDIDMEMEVSFWNGGLTANKLVLSFDRGDIEKLRLYLQLVTAEIDRNEPAIQNLISSGSLYG